MSKTTNKLIQVTLKMTFITMVVLGTFFGIEGAANVAVFMALLFGFISTLFLLLFTLIPDEKEKEVFEKWDPIFPYWLFIGLELGVLIIMIWNGWIVTSFIYSLSVFIKIFAYEMKKKCNEEILDARQHEQ